MPTPFSENLLVEMAAIEREIDALQCARDGKDVFGTTPNGEIRVRLRENNVFSAVDIDPAVVKSGSSAELGQLVLAAVNAANERLNEQRNERIASAIQAMLDDCFSRGRDSAARND